MKRLLLLFVLLLPFVVADDFVFDHELYSAESIDLEVVVSGDIAFSGSASELSATLLYFPIALQGTRVLDTSLSPSPSSLSGESVVFSWSTPSSPVSFSHASVVRSSFYRPVIREAVSFPFVVPADKQRYLQSSQIIRVTDDIAAQASSIVGDEQDAVRATFLLGSWVKENIAYELTSVTAEASQTSQWVLENRYGVCDELTSLFIAMLRSQGIPARFVSGLAYTNLEVLDTFWGPHGWAEVWFPEVGWVPYDVTYGQFGWVDATHIPFMTSVDARTNAAEYSVRGRNVVLDPAGVSTDVSLLGSSGSVVSDVDVSLSVAHASVGLSSANRLDVTLRNTRDFYVSVDVQLASPSRLASSDYERSVLLAPREEAVVRFFLEFDEPLDPGYSYTFPLAVFVSNEEVFSTEFSARSGARSYSKESLGFVRESAFRDVLFCEYSPQVVVNSELWVSCSKDGSVVCVEGVCERDEVSLRFTPLEPGSLSLHASSEGVSRFINVLVVDEASFEVSLAYPSEVLFSDEVFVNVTLTSSSVTDASDIVATLSHPLFVQEFSVRILSDEASISLRVPSEHLLLGENEFVLSTNYGHEEFFVVTARSDGFASWITLLMNRFAAWTNTLF
ncbi:MAG: transglutaminase-like domain-containing protein [Candidatus Woesearchaeota archaeon]